MSSIMPTGNHFFYASKKAREYSTILVGTGTALFAATKVGTNIALRRDYWKSILLQKHSITLHAILGKGVPTAAVGSIYVGSMIWLGASLSNIDDRRLANRQFLDGRWRSFN